MLHSPSGTVWQLQLAVNTDLDVASPRRVIQINSSHRQSSSAQANRNREARAIISGKSRMALEDGDSASFDPKVICKALESCATELGILTDDYLAAYRELNKYEFA